LAQRFEVGDIICFDDTIAKIAGIKLARAGGELSITLNAFTKDEQGAVWGPQKAPITVKDKKLQRICEKAVQVVLLGKNDWQGVAYREGTTAYTGSHSK
tara:strand:- start:567 stop:863 length:297 start_codon:yes stop_codon:yes gene_type:complete